MTTGEFCRTYWWFFVGVAICALMIAVSVSGWQYYSIEHPISCKIWRADAGTAVHIQYLGGRDWTFVEYVRIEKNGETVITIDRPRVRDRWWIPAVNLTPEGDYIEVIARDESGPERTIARWRG
ncbi:MAG: hypothetical protein WC683_11805 [bacterium]